MLPRKTDPAPIFNCRKRPRQAFVTDPGTQPSSAVCKESASNRNTQEIVSSSSEASNKTLGMIREPGCNGPLPRAPRGPSPNTRPSTAGASWRGTHNRQATSVAVPKTEWTGSVPARPSKIQPAVSGPSHGSVRRQQPSPCQPSRSPFIGENMSSSVHQTSVLPKQRPMPGIDQARETRMTSDRSLRVLTLPVAHVKRIFGLHSDTVPPFLICLFGIVDSATVTDSASSGKSFTLRDETGRIMCIFCEIDRQMPRLHRGQWYRVVGVVKPWWQAVQCLSLRPVSGEERQTARGVTSHCTKVLSELCLNIKEQ